MLSCVRHCDRNKAVIFFGPQPLPCAGVCPSCSQPFKRVEKDKQDVPILVAPFVMPCPFVSTPHAEKDIKKMSVPPMCLLLRPSEGDFLSSYQDGDILHIGVVNASGDAITHFDESGIHVDSITTTTLNGTSSSSSPWSLAIAIRLHNDPSLAPLARVSDSAWDKAVKVESSEERWESIYYHASSHSCFDFVLACLERVARSFHVVLPVTSAAEGDSLFSKDHFSQRCLLTVAKRAGHYIDLYKRTAASADGCIILDHAAT